MLPIYIMTRGRPNKQITMEHLPDDAKRMVSLVCNHDEVTDYVDAGWDEYLLPADDSVKDYSSKMQFCLDMIRDHDRGKGIIMDDDLWFDIRRTDAQKLRKPTHPDELLPMFNKILTLLDSTPLVGIHPRQFGHAKPLPYVENGKVVCVQAVNLNLFPANFPRVDRWPILSDVWLNCGLLSRGYGNKLITEFVVDWAPVMADGGCSSYRDHEMQKQGCLMLEEEFGPYLKVVKKKTKSDGFGGERYDFNVQWKRLYAAGAAKRSV